MRGRLIAEHIENIEICCPARGFRASQVTKMPQMHMHEWSPGDEVRSNIQCRVRHEPNFIKTLKFLYVLHHGTSFEQIYAVDPASACAAPLQYS